MKKLGILSLSGALIGCVLFSWLGPQAITWWFKPPVNVPIDCTDALHWAMRLLLKFQMAGLAVGLTLGAIFSFIFSRKDKS